MRPILTIGDPFLRRRARPVEKVTGAVRRLAEDLLATMYAHDGVGLAATQVGVDLRVMVVDAGEGPVVLVNPEILSSAGEEVGVEGCLSVPGLAGEVARAQEVRVRALDLQGETVWLEASGLLARVIQHEIDHLNGVLFVDRALRVWEIPPESRVRFIFFGTPEFSARVLEGLLAGEARPVAVVTRPDRPRGRGWKERPSPVKELALREGIEVWQPENLSSPAFLEEVRRAEPEVLVVAGYGAILPSALLALPPWGGLNLHPSLLPRYRGMAPVIRALMNGEKVTGVTVMRMTPRVDAGEIVMQEEVEIAPDDDREILERKLARVGTKLLLRALRLIARGEGLPAKPQDESRATYAPPLRPEEEWIDWTRPAREIVNLVRALSPAPGASAFLGSRRVKILRAELTEGRGVPGEVLGVDKEGFTIAAGEGAVRVLAVKPAGGRAMDAGAYLRGHRLLPGEVVAPRR